MEQKNGLIIKGTGGLYDILLDGGETVSCRAKGIFRHESLTPTVGDRVSVGSDDHGNSIIDGIDERKNILIRPPLANLDILFIVIPSKRPIPDYYTADKLSAIAYHNGIQPVIIASKCALDENTAENTENIYKNVFPTFVTDAVSGIGISGLEKYIGENCAGKISAFSGASGAGKSTLMNALFPSLGLSTSEVSARTGRGRHTTRTVELFKTPSGAFIADTPGFTMLDFAQFDFFDLEHLPLAFPEIEKKLGECRYTKCTHRKEEGCAVLDGIKKGDISSSRHESYKALYEILKNKHSWDKKQ